jgi:hypothetical protein
MDADDSDVAAMQRKINYANAENIPELQDNKSVFKKSCRTGKPSGKPFEGEYDAARSCYSVYWSESTGMSSAAIEQILLKGCSYDYGGLGLPPCLVLARRYVDEGRNIEALAILEVPNAKVASPSDQSKSDYLEWYEISFDAYKSIGNTEAERNMAEKLCYDFNLVGYCTQLQVLGEKVDIDDAHKRSIAQLVHEVIQQDADSAQAKTDRQANEKQNRQDKTARQAAIDNAISSIGSTQQPTYRAPVYSPPGTASNPSYTPAGNSQSLPQGCPYVTSSIVLTPHFSREPASSWCTNGGRMDVGWTVSNSSGSGVTCAIKFGQDSSVSYQTYSGGGQLENACAFDDKVQYVCWRTDDNASCSGKPVNWSN